MRWPSPQDYREAIQNPSTCLSDEELRKGELLLDKLGLPVVQSGQYASVFKLTSGQQSWAVRCFLHNFADRAERYRYISDFIARDQLDSTVGFELIDKGIRVGSEWFPILKMEYVDGEPLGRYIRSNLHNKEKLRSLLSGFEEMILALKSDGVAHGDLQHDNVVVTKEGQLRLIDYDGMFVPALKGWHSNELGHRNYQHPSRSDTDFDPKLDNFSAWLIRGALRCLIEDPGLSGRISRSEESLLLMREDFIAPDCAAGFFELEKGNKLEKTFSRQMRTLLRCSPEAAPFLDEELIELASLPPVVLPMLPVRKQASTGINPQVGRPENGNAPSPRQAYRLPLKPGAKPSVLATFGPAVLCTLNGDLNFGYQSSLKAHLKATLLPGEHTLWSGGLSPLKRETQTPPGKVSVDVLPVIVTLFPMLMLVVLVQGPITQPILFFYFLFVLYSLFKRQLSHEPKHALYELTDFNLKIVTVAAQRKFSETFIENDFAYVDIPVSSIKQANFFKGNEQFNEAVELVLSDISISNASLWLYGFTQKDRQSFMTCLRSLGVQCISSKKP